MVLVYQQTRKVDATMNDMTGTNAVKNKYRCKHCGKVVERESDKKWISSYCSATGKDVRLIKVDTKADPVPTRKTETA